MIKVLSKAYEELPMNYNPIKGPQGMTIIPKQRSFTRLINRIPEAAWSGLEKMFKAPDKYPEESVVAFEAEYGGVCFSGNYYFCGMFEIHEISAKEAA